MKPQSPALTTTALATAAGRKTRRVHQKLRQAETEMHDANAVLAQAAPGSDASLVQHAVQLNEEAERKVHEATRELEVVKEMLEHADGAGTPVRLQSGGKTGHGVQSLLEHLRNNG